MQSKERSKDQRLVLVAGATGRQGGAVARLLLERGHAVRALVRSAHSPRAKELERLGAELVRGDFGDPGSLNAAARGMDALFAATPYEPPETEIRHGTNLIEAASAAGLPHFVYSSVASADRHTGIPHFESKREVEQRLERIGIPYTVIAPVAFMENILAPWSLPSLQQGNLAMALPPMRALQQISVANIASFAAVVLERPDEFVGERIDIAADDLTGTEAAEVLSGITAREIQFSEIPIEQVRSMGEDLASMAEWLNRVGYDADVEGLRRDYPEVGWQTFEEWAKAQEWGFMREPATAGIVRGADRNAG